MLDIYGILRDLREKNLLLGCPCEDMHGLLKEKDER